MNNYLECRGYGPFWKKYHARAGANSKNKCWNPWENFARGARQADRLTLLAVRYRDPKRGPHGYSNASTLERSCLTETVSETPNEKPTWISMLGERELIHFILRKFLSPALICKTYLHSLTFRIII